MRSNSKAFTLLELIVVLVIIGIISSIVFVRVGRSVAVKRPRLFAREMARLCREARRVALANGTVSAFYISSDERKCWVDNRELIAIPEDMRVEGQGVQQLEHGIFGIRFFPDGSSSGGSLFVSRGGSVLYAFRVDLLTGLIMPMEKEQ